MSQKYQQLQIRLIEKAVARAVTRRFFLPKGWKKREVQKMMPIEEMEEYVNKSLKKGAHPWPVDKQEIAKLFTISKKNAFERRELNEFSDPEGQITLEKFRSFIERKRENNIVYLAKLIIVNLVADLSQTPKEVVAQAFRTHRQAVYKYFREFRDISAGNEMASMDIYEEAKETIINKLKSIS